jgi:serine protease DegS
VSIQVMRNGKLLELVAEVGLRPPQQVAPAEND